MTELNLSCPSCDSANTVIVADFHDPEKGYNVESITCNDCDFEANYE